MNALLVNLLTAAIVAAWLGAIAIFSIQNITPVSLQFFTFTSLQLPVGVLLSFSVGVGLLFGALLPLFWQPKRGNRRRLSEGQGNDLRDFDFDLP